MQGSNTLVKLTICLYFACHVLFTAFFWDRHWSVISLQELSNLWEHLERVTHYRWRCYRIVGNIHEFQGSRAICKSFLHKILRHAAPTCVWFQSVKKSLPMDPWKFTAIQYIPLFLFIPRWRYTFWLVAFNCNLYYLLVSLNIASQTLDFDTLISHFFTFTTTRNAHQSEYLVFLISIIINNTIIYVAIEGSSGSPPKCPAFL